MFARKRIIKAIVLECDKQINYYYENILKLAKGEFLQDTDFDDEKKAMIIRTRYLNGVAFDAFNRIRKSQQATTLINLLVQCPEKCGYDISIDNGISAGMAFAIAFFAITKKTADEKYCVALNHYQYNLMDKALIKADALAG